MVLVNFFLDTCTVGRVDYNKLWLLFFGKVNHKVNFGVEYLTALVTFRMIVIRYEII